MASPRAIPSMVGSQDLILNRMKCSRRSGFVENQNSKTHADEIREKEYIMKKMFLLALFLLVPFTALATFPVTSKLTIEESQPGFVKVSGSEQDLSYINVLQQDCIDSLRAGCGKSVTINPSEVGQGYKIFPLDPEARMDGQNAYNFRTEKNGEWLHIPDCNVEMGASTDMEMSSNGAHFVSVSVGRGIFDSIASGGGCGGGYQATAKPAYVPPVAYRAPKVVEPPCNPCADTIAIRASVGEISPADSPDKRTLQQKVRIVGVVTDSTAADVKKIGAHLKVPGFETPVVPVAPPAVASASAGSGIPWWMWLVLAIMGVAIVLLVWRPWREREDQPQQR